MIPFFKEASTFLQDFNQGLGETFATLFYLPVIEVLKINTAYSASFHSISTQSVRNFMEKLKFSYSAVFLAYLKGIVGKQRFKKMKE